MADDKMVQLAVDTIRTLSMDAVQAAKSKFGFEPERIVAGARNLLL